MIYTPEQFAVQIRQRGFRLTPQRAAILNALSQAGERLSPLEIFEKAWAALPGITEPTVYRTLDFLMENGFVNIITHGRRLVYELAQPSHYLLICSACGLKEELSHEWLQTFRDQLEQITGFSLTENQITFTGLCQHCK